MGSKKNGHGAVVKLPLDSGKVDVGIENGFRVDAVIAGTKEWATRR